MSHIVLIITVICTSIGAWSQNGFPINGIVTDKLTGTLLKFAKAEIKGTNICSNTNSSGEFSLVANRIEEFDTLCISYLGYETVKIPLTKKLTIPLYVQLSLKSRTLAVVNIHAQAPLLLLKQALAKIPDNYSNAPYWMDGNYTGFQKEDSSIIEFSQAHIGIKRLRYCTDHDLDSIEIQEGLTSTTRPGSTFAKNYIYELTGPFDFVKSKRYFLDHKEFNYYSYKQEHDSIYKGYPVYIISFDQKTSVHKPLFAGKIYLDCESLAFVKIEYTMSKIGFKYWDTPFLWNAGTKLFIHSRDRPISHYFCVEYEKQSKKWHQAYAQFKYEKRRDSYGDAVSCYLLTQATLTIKSTDSCLTDHLVDKEKLATRYSCSVPVNKKHQSSARISSKIFNEEKKKLLRFKPDSVSEGYR